MFPVFELLGENMEDQGFTKLMQLAELHGYENSIGCGSRTKWFNEVTDGLFDRANNGIFSDYKSNKPQQLRRKFTSSLGLVVRKFFTPGVHCDNITGLDNDSNLPSCYPYVKRYLDTEELAKTTNKRKENERIEKHRIENIIFAPLASLRSANCKQVCDRTELS